MLDVEQFQKIIVRPTLNYLGFGGAAAEQLLIGTALTESRLQYLKQRFGPARGVFQMEPATHDDIWENYLKHKDEIREKICTLLTQQNPVDQLYGNLAYACAMARIHYLRIPEKLPQSKDLPAMAKYWKKYYNTHLGKGETSHFTSAAFNFFNNIKD